MQSTLTEKLLEPLIHHNLTDVQMFKNEIGGAAQMVEFIKEYQKEWATGKLAHP